MGLVNGLRGHYIISQALYYGIQSLSEVEGIHREKSNISDMQYLREYVFPIFPGVPTHVQGETS